MNLAVKTTPLTTAPKLAYDVLKARDAINRRLYKGLIIVKMAIYRVFAI